MIDAILNSCLGQANQPVHSDVYDPSDSMGEISAAFGQQPTCTGRRVVDRKGVSCVVREALTGADACPTSESDDSLNEMSANSVATDVESCVNFGLRFLSGVVVVVNRHRGILTFTTCESGSHCLDNLNRLLPRLLTFPFVCSGIFGRKRRLLEQTSLRILAAVSIRIDSNEQVD